MSTQPKKLLITETILRDAHQCLIATRMRTEDMLPICDKLDKVGFWSLEAWGGATFDTCLRFLKEDPWQRLKQLKAALPNTKIQMLLRGQNILGYRHYADDVVEAFIKKAAQHGVDVFRVFDALNDPRNLATSIKAIKKQGKHAQGAISYTQSPVHNTDTFIKLAKALENMGCDSLAIKDMAGLLTPQAIKQLLPALFKAVNIPIHIHSHATSGLATTVLYEAVMSGCCHIDTALSSFAEGASHPATESLVAAFKDTPYDTQLDLTLLGEINEYFRVVRRKYHQYESEATRVDPRVHINQIPGGMISNLYNQLREQNAIDKFSQVLDEVPVVRKDLGYPPLVTPTSQVVGTQAVLNILTGKRYETVTNEVKLYLGGYYGQAPGVVNADLVKKTLGKQAPITCRPADLLKPELQQLKNKAGDLIESEEDLLSYALFPDVATEYFQQRASGDLQPEVLLDADESTTISKPSKLAVTFHGETYNVNIRGAGAIEKAKRPIYLTVDGVPEEVMVETLDLIKNEGQHTGANHNQQRPIASQPGHVTVAMPCAIVDVLVAVGDKVKAGQALFITEAMKMETEVQAPIAGTVKAINISKGDKVNPQDLLIDIVDA